MNKERYMLRAVELARLAAGQTSPNPMVGAVLVDACGRIIGEGYHHRCGEAHAEVNAVASVADPSQLPMATMFVTLEPCSHHGKTPPCAEMIIKSGIKRVVVGCEDPFSQVCGRGIERLRQAGVDVEVGVCYEQCRELNKRFITAQTKGRPYVILKWAESADGYLDIERDATIAPAWFTGEDARKMVHKWRAEEDAIMVGRRTAELDNPRLTVRIGDGRNPLRVVTDRNGTLSNDLHLFDNEADTLVFSSKPHERQGADIEVIDYDGNTVAQMLSILHCRGVQSLIVEGGAKLLNSFIDSELWDEARIFIAQNPIAYYYPQVAYLHAIAAPKLPKTARNRDLPVQELLVSRLIVATRQ